MTKELKIIKGLVDLLEEVDFTAVPWDLESQEEYVDAIEYMHDQSEQILALLEVRDGVLATLNSMNVSEEEQKVLIKSTKVVDKIIKGLRKEL